jgi:hypothetical protein
VNADAGGTAKSPLRLDALPELIRQRDLRELGLTRTDADRVIALCPGIVRFGKAVYVRREDVVRVLAAALDTSEVR